jgi:hypothetical protein
MLNDEAIAAARKLGAVIPTGRAMAAEIIDVGETHCPTCGFVVQRYLSCEQCGQMLEWSWLYGHIEFLTRNDRNPEVAGEHPSDLRFWPSTSLVRCSFIVRRELRTPLAENDRRHLAERREKCIEELDRRSARGIEDD